ncbi:hypothetical protein J437_LFUL007009 [Ladona fulva]|uniref:Uncharacterized protein n=1 Tax=Ladona fulva TaxID=123851 RepID=A0A8K0P096_LADFU|nr:hypothetical protein J437_LFUL007009 [Ladona fulva]
MHFHFSQGMNISMTFSKPTSYVIITLMNTKTAKEMDLSKKYDGLSCSFPALSKNYSLMEVKAFKDEQCDDEIKYERRSYQEHPACWTIATKGESALLAQDTMSNDYEILLLYAKDCKEFMVTMESFRHVLGELCNVKMNRADSDAIIGILRAETENLKNLKEVLQSYGITGNQAKCYD